MTKHTPNPRPAPTRGPSAQTAYRPLGGDVRAVPLDKRSKAGYDQYGRLHIEPGIGDTGGASY